MNVKVRVWVRFNSKKGGVDGEKWRYLYYVRNPRNLSILEEVSLPTAKKDTMVLYFFQILFLGRKNSWLVLQPLNFWMYLVPC
jgi:hypothetical protein